jgi:hypothetical protein
MTRRWWQRWNNWSTRTAAGIAVDTRGGVDVHTPGQDTAHQTIDVDSDALYPVFVDAVAASYAAGFAGMPTLTDLVKAMEPSQ